MVLSSSAPEGFYPSSDVRQNTVVAQVKGVAKLTNWLSGSPGLHLVHNVPVTFLSEYFLTKYLNKGLNIEVSQFHMAFFAVLYVSI